MTNSEPEVFGGARCAWVASHLSKHLKSCWIFSIFSDERIPNELEHRLLHAHVSEQPSHLIIVGDFPFIPPERSPASFEAIRLLAKAAGFLGAVRVCWLDSETIDISSTSPPNFTWHEFPFNMQYRAMSEWPSVLSILESERAICDEMMLLLDGRPGIRLSDDGHVEALNLTDGEPYSRSLVRQLSCSEQNQLWSLILRLSSLRELNARFSNLHEIPDLSRLRYLENLDLRGNPRIELDKLSRSKSLKKLNISACELAHVPLGIEHLINLHTLLLHKNSISDVSTIAFPPLLERLSLYRNQISLGKLDLSQCERITEVNLGANPIEDIIVNIPDAVVNFILRLRHVENRVRIAWRGSISIEPASIRIY